jgi:hypothetical protein
MKKDITHCIAFYTRKVAEKGAVHPAKVQPRNFKYRNERLMTYKKLMHEAIANEGYKIK